MESGIEQNGAFWLFYNMNHISSQFKSHFFFKDFLRSIKILLMMCYFFLSEGLAFSYKRKIALKVLSSKLISLCNSSSTPSFQPKLCQIFLLQKKVASYLKSKASDPRPTIQLRRFSAYNFRMIRRRSAAFAESRDFGLYIQT